MPSCLKKAPILDSETFLKALLEAPRPGSDKVLAFYDSRTGAICRDPALMLLPLDDHMCHRGDGLFESVHYRDRKIFGLDAHLDRLFKGAERLSIEPPSAKEETKELIRQVAKAGEKPRGDLRVFLSRGAGGFGVSPDECPAASLYIVALDARLPNPAMYEKGLSAFSSAIPPKQDYLAQIKNTNYLPNVFMAREAKARGMDVAVSFDKDGFMGEAAIANIAIVDKNGVLRSPELDKVLPGTTLLASLKLAEKRMPVKLGPVHISELDGAREILLFSSAPLCVGITQFDGKPVGAGEMAGKPGPVALWLKDALLDYLPRHGVSF